MWPDLNIVWALNSPMFVSLLVALVLGSLLGLERSLSGKVAGMRTYGLVSLGAAVFVLVAQQMTEQYALLGAIPSDPLRMASQVVVGIGFLGAGLIIFHDEKVRGLTTAAGLWVAAGVGMAAGYGLYMLAFSVTILTLLVFTVFQRVERYFEEKLGNIQE